MVTSFRVGRMAAQGHGPQLVWVEMQTDRGKTVPFVCSVVHALELAELLEEEAIRPMPQPRVELVSFRGGVWEAAPVAIAEPGPPTHVVWAASR
jgi:hypothetical protein